MIEVRPGRVALAAGVLVGLFVAAAYCVRTVPDRVVTLVGGPEGGVARYGGVQLRYHPSADSKPELLHLLEARTQVRRDGAAFLLEFPGVAEDMGSQLVDVLANGGLQMREVLNGEHAQQIGASGEVTVEVDAWRGDQGPAVEDLYLRAPTREALVQAIERARQQGWAPARGREIAFEHVEPYDPEAVPHWRTYEVSSLVEIDGTMVADATMSYDPNTNRPIVLLDFTEAGGHAFAEMTTRLTGKKLAMMLGNRIQSAPVVNSPIHGGRVSITMGGPAGGEERAEREAVMLVGVLRTGSLPVGGRVEDVRWLPPSEVATQEWLGRAVLGAAAGLVFGLVVFATIRVARPRWRAPPVRPDGPIPWRRVAVTLLGPLALIVGAKITLPGINAMELELVGPDGASGPFSVVALGLAPIVTAFVLVELVALAVPGLRWRRHDPVGRVRLGQAVAILAIVLAVVQGFFVASTFEAYGRFSFADQGLVVSNPGLQFRLVDGLARHRHARARDRRRHDPRARTRQRLWRAAGVGLPDRARGTLCRRPEIRSRAPRA